MEGLQISFASLIDVLFLLQVFCSDMDYLKTSVRAETFVEQLEKLVVKHGYNMEEAFLKILDLMDYLYDESFKIEDFSFLRDIIKG